MPDIQKWSIKCSLQYIPFGIQYKSKIQIITMYNIYGY